MVQGIYLQILIENKKKNLYPGTHSDQGYPTNSGFFPQERMTKHFSLKWKWEQNTLEGQSAVVFLNNTIKTLKIFETDKYPKSKLISRTNQHEIIHGASVENIKN